MAEKGEEPIGFVILEKDQEYSEDYMEQLRDFVGDEAGDIAKPGQDGYQLIRHVRGMGTAAASSIPAAALTAFAHPEDRQRALAAGFHMHLTKPIGQRALVDAVIALSRVSAR